MKNKKIPGIFRKSYKEKSFNRKILKRIHIPKDRKMIADLFVKNEAGKMEIIREIPDEILARLKPLSKSIKKNRGLVSRWKAGIVLVIFGAALVFNFFFKDKLIEQTAEAGLSSVFKAEADIREPRISLFKGVVSYQALSIADAGNPFRNLIETGPGELKISIPELTRKRIRIETMSLTGVRWDTPRETSGELDPDEKAEAEKTQGTLDKTLDVLALNQADFDYKALIEEQKENLKSLNLLDQGNREYEEFTQRWKGIYDQKEKEIEMLTREVSSFKTVSTQSLDSVEEIQSMGKQVKDFIPKLTRAKQELLNLREDFLAEKARLGGLRDQVSNTIDEDMAYLNSLLDFSPGNLRSLASDAGEKYIRNRWNDYYEKGRKALEVYERLQDRKKEEAEKKNPSRRDGGRVILFPAPDNPAFLIREVLLSGGDSKTGELKLEAFGISSEPDKLPAPLSFSAGWIKADTAISLDGLIDSRKEAPIPFSMDIRSPENSLFLEKGIPALKVNELSSRADISGSAVSQKDSRTLLTALDISLSEIMIRQDDPGDFIARTVKSILDDIPRAQMTADILVGRDGLKEVRVKTDLDEILSDRIGEYLKEQAGEITEKLKESLMDFLSPYWEENQAVQSAADALGVESLDQISSVNDLEKLMQTKQDELNNQAGVLRDQAQAEIDKAAAQARAEADKLEAQARAEADRREAQAKEEAAGVLEDAAKKIKIPGF